MTLYIGLCGHPPYPVQVSDGNIHLEDIEDAITSMDRLRYSDRLKTSASLMLNRMLQQDQHSRGNALELASEPWLTRDGKLRPVRLDLRQQSPIQPSKHDVGRAITPVNRKSVSGATGASPATGNREGNKEASRRVHMSKYSMGNF